MHISKLLESEKQESIARSVDAHRDKLKEMENEETERKRAYKEKLEQVRQRMLFLKEKREQERKEKELLENEMISQVEEWTNESSDENDANQYENFIEDDETTTDSGEENEDNVEKDENYEETFHLPSVIIKSQPDNVTNSIDNENIEEKIPPGGTSKKKIRNKLPKIHKKKRKNKKKRSKQAVDDNKLPQIKNIKNKLNIALSSSDNQTTKDNIEDKKHNQETLNKYSKPKNKLTTKMKKKQDDKKEDEGEEKTKEPKYLEVDLVSKHNVQQIVLEVSFADLRCPNDQTYDRKIQSRFSTRRLFRRT